MEKFEKLLNELKTKKQKIYYQDLVCYIDSALKGEVIHQPSNDTKNKHQRIINKLKKVKTGKEINDLRNQLILLHRPFILKLVCRYILYRDLNISILDAYDYVLINTCEYLKTDNKFLEYSSVEYFSGALRFRVLNFIRNYLGSSEVLYKERV